MPYPLIDSSVTAQIVLSWSQKDYASGNTSNYMSDAGSFLYNRTWASGTGTSGQVASGYSAVGQVWSEQNTLASGGFKTYDMTALPGSVFGTSYNEAMSNVRLVYVENISTASGYDIVIRATGTNGFTNLFGGTPSSTGELRLGPKSPFVYANYYTGFPVSATNKFLSVNDIGGSGATYRIGIMGI